MIKGASGYDPATLFRAKREKQRAQIEQSKAQKSPAVPNADAESASKEDEYGIFEDAMKFISQAKPAVAGMNEKFEEMKKLAAASLNTALSDEDRKQINKKFLNLRNEMDATARSTEFNGRKLFDGELDDLPLKLKVGIHEREFVEVRFGSLLNEDTGIEGLKVDTLVNARKASKELEESGRKYQVAALTLKTKEDSILAKKRIYDELEGSSSASPSKSDPKPGDLAFQEKLRLALFSDLREKQKYLSTVQGREVALLINKKA